MNLQVNSKTAVSIFDAPVQQREAWRMLAAEHSNSREITPDRWRLLATAFAGVADDILNQAVIMHMAESPFFPRLADLKAQIDKLVPAQPFDIFISQMAAAGYVFIQDDGETAVFQGNGITATVCH